MMRDGSQWNKGDAKRILLNTFWMLFDRIFILMLNLIVTVRVANHFGSQEYGSYEYAVSIIALLEILVNFVDGRVVKKYYLACDGDTVVFNATVCRVIFSILSALIGAIYILFCGRGMRYSIIFAILLLNAIITNLRFGMTNRFEYLLKAQKAVITADISALIGGVLQLVAVQMNWSLIAISVIAAVTSVINLLIISVQYYTEFGGGRIHGRFRRDLVTQMIHESIPLAIAASCATVYTKCDSVMLGNMMGDEMVGIYAISVKLLNVVQIAIGPIRESVFPKMMQLYDTNRKEYERLYVRITSFSTWLCIVGVSLSFLILPYLFRFLSEDYVQSFPVYRLLAVSALFTYNASLRAGHYTITGRGDILMYAQIFSVFLNIALNFVGIHFLGMYGAALATVITQGVSLLLSNAFFGKEGRQVFWWQIKALNPVRMVH